jgi:trans-AT polyketide synthase/acyltransferase/oxidoreductase domain-containing protein
MIEPLQNTRLDTYWTQGDLPPQTDAEGLQNALYSLNQPFVLVNQNGQPAAAKGGSLSIQLTGDLKGFDAPPDRGVTGIHRQVLAYTPSLLPEDLGDPEFKKRHNLRYAYVGGAMANGITSTAMVEAMGKAGMMGFYGAAGLTLTEVEKAIYEVQRKLGDFPYGFNLIHSPGDPDLEDALADLYIKQGIRKVCASAYLNLTLALVRYRVSGIYQDSLGNIVCPNQVIAKVSREEVAQRFFSPPPEKFLVQLLENKTLTQAQVALARHVPMADSLTAEADSGGHTDNRPAISLLPTLIALRNEMVKIHRYWRRHRNPAGRGSGVFNGRRLCSDRVRQSGLRGGRDIR